MRKPALLITVLALAAFGFTACGDDEEDSGGSETTAETTEETTSSSGGGEGGTVALTANPDGDLAYEETEASTAAGEVTVEFDNPAPLGHDVVVEDESGNELIRTDIVTGESTSASGSLEAGTYTFYCSVDGHQAAGMEGTLTVE